ncbi:COX15/CtaA family protein [Virgibacillus profundi]|uniref:COX15/CtaA family protein n=1 Tax=Virgibacillus profundi TaxID=2024555 RepID=UPI0013FD1F13|nr:COX15/CtaA family protein [Virgibacillus profundi]
MSKEKLALSAIILTYFLIVFGGYVASSESGMGCGPDWPLCNGEVIPELQGDTLIEFGHRVIGAILFIMTILLFIKVKKENNRLANKVANYMLGLLTLQLIMGAIVVFYHLPSFIITLHLLIAMIFLGLLIWFWRYEVPYTYNKYSEGFVMKRHLNILIALLFFTMGIGAYIKHQHYGLACGWLDCGDTILPASIPELLQTAHRLLAIITVIYILYITYKVLSMKLTILRTRVILSLMVILAQLIIGVMTILSFVAISFAVLHLAAATLLFAIIVEARIAIEN